MSIENDIRGLVQELREDPANDAVRDILADALDDIGPGEVKGGIPDWLRLCWIRLAPEKLRGWRIFSTAKWSVQQDMSDLFFSSKIGGFDHTGVTSIAGLECFVTEPYARECGIEHLLDPLIEILPCCAYAYSRRSYYSTRRQVESWVSVWRGILLPPLEMPAPVSKRKRARKTPLVF